MLDDLIIKYNSVVVKILLEGKTSIYPLKTIENLLVHYEKIKNEDDRNEILKRLNEYLDYILLYGLSSKEDFVNTYDTFIQPFVEKYRKNAGFIYFVGFIIPILTIIIINFFLYLFYSNSLVFLLFNSFALFYFLFLFYKVKTKRVYGPTY